MVSFTALPKTLLILLLASPVLTTLPSSPNDPFRAIVLVRRKLQPEPPLCCLIHPASTEPSSDVEDVLLSFEEWKSRQLHSQSHSQPHSQPSATPHPKTDALEHLESSTTHEPDVSLPDPSAYPHETELSPHFRVPITDRFNYANLDCSARVHTSHRSAKSPSSILSSKKDKYMLSPCSSDKEERQFVIVELCDDIRIDTVQLANFEFFSGVFKDFSVKVAKTYSTSDEGWVLAGTYRAKNVRGVQSFHTPTTLRDFYRYIRIDFHSHYGHEYYCPISLLRVYGLTHLEQWKWDLWEEESARNHAQVKDFSSGTEPLPISSGASELNKYMDELQSRNIPSAYYFDTAPPVIMTHSPVYTGSNNNQATSMANPTSSPAVSSSRSDTHGDQSASSSPIVILDYTESTPKQPTASASPLSESNEMRRAASSLDSAVSSIASTLSNESPDPTSTEVSYNSNIHVSLSQPSPITHHTPATNPVSTTHPTFSSLPLGSNGESIYRTIMTRLTLLEANHSLYARYVEEQTAGVRGALKRLGEDIGRLESISRIQAQMYQRTVYEWERQRLRLEFEHGELLSRVNYLAEEVVMEKRLGIAQLCLLLAVLVFMGLTRGASSIVHPQLTNHSTREWGRRNLSFTSTGERGWNPLGPRSRSPPDVTTGKRSEKDRHPSNLDSRVEFPVHRTRRSSELEPTLRRSLHAPPFADKRSTPRASASMKQSATLTAVSVFRTPTRRIPGSTSLDIYTLPRPHMTRTNSHSSGGLILPKSTRLLARSAHLHEVKSSRSRRDSLRERENECGDVFSAPPVKKHHHSRRFSSPRRPLSPLDLSRQPADIKSEDITDGDAWIDTDAEEGSECSEFASFDPHL